MTRKSLCAVPLLALALGACATQPPPDHVMQADWTKIHRTTDTLLDRPAAEYFWSNADTTGHIGRVRLAGGEPPCRRIEIEVWQSIEPIHRFESGEPELPILRRIYRLLCPNDAGVYIRHGADEREIGDEKLTTAAPIEPIAPGDPTRIQEGATP